MQLKIQGILQKQFNKQNSLQNFIHQLQGILSNRSKKLEKNKKQRAQPGSNR